MAGRSASGARRRTEGELFSPFGLDVFVYPRWTFANMPPFSIGAFSWDNWLLHEARQRGLPVVDLTAATGVIHQNHAYREFASAEEYRRSPRAQRNYWLAGDSVHGLSSAADATHVLADGEIIPADTRTVSVVISDTGTAHQLAACLAAFEYQTYPRTFTEVTVAIESGRPGPNAVLADFPFVKRVRAAAPGRPAARNKGAAVAGGELLAFLDSEVLPGPDWVEQAVTGLATARRGLHRGQHAGGAAAERRLGAVGYYESVRVPSRQGRCARSYAGRRWRADEPGRVARRGAVRRELADECVGVCLAGPGARPGCPRGSAAPPESGGTLDGRWDQLTAGVRGVGPRRSGVAPSWIRTIRSGPARSDGPLHEAAGVGDVARRPAGRRRAGASQVGSPGCSRVGMAGSAGRERARPPVADLGAAPLTSAGADAVTGSVTAETRSTRPAAGPTGVRLAPSRCRAATVARFRRSTPMWRRGIGRARLGAPAAGPDLPAGELPL